MAILGAKTFAGSVVTVTMPEGEESAVIVGKPGVWVSPTIFVAFTL